MTDRCGARANMHTDHCGVESRARRAVGECKSVPELGGITAPLSPLNEVSDTYTRAPPSEHQPPVWWWEYIKWEHRKEFPHASPRRKGDSDFFFSPLMSKRKRKVYACMYVCVIHTSGPHRTMCTLHRKHTEISPQCLRTQPRVSRIRARRPTGGANSAAHHAYSCIIYIHTFRHPAATTQQCATVDSQQSNRTQPYSFEPTSKARETILVEWECELPLL